MPLPLPVPSHRPQSSMGYSVVEMSDDNVPALRPAVPEAVEVPPSPALRVVLVGEETDPTAVQRRPPRGEPAPVKVAPTPAPARIGILLAAFALAALLGGFPLLLLLAVNGTPRPSVRPIDHVTGMADRNSPLPAIEPSTALMGLVPDAAQAKADPVYLGKDLAAVPELALEAAPGALAGTWRTRKARVAAASLKLNGKERDGFLKALVHARADLVGVPFAMGDECRTTGDRARAFKEAAESVRSQKFAPVQPVVAGREVDKDRQQRAYAAHLAVVHQVLPTEEPNSQTALVHSLASIPRAEATRALARLAVFSADDAARAAAVEALAVRREADSADILAAGLAYPWPAVADNAAWAIVRLKREDLVPQLKAMLDAPDPRAPRKEMVNGKEETVAHELVRVNHLRNCMLCHAAAERGKTPNETLVAEVPVPTEPLPDTSGGYGQSGSNLLVRIDVTYLRQDFSAMLNVADWTVGPWPVRQRFDFVVRKRVLTPAEADDLRERLPIASPYQRLAKRTLHELAARADAAKGG